jgi:uncharacterized protein
MTRPIFLTAEWRHLAMINYEVDPRILQPFVPAGTELDEWNGCTYASMVGFLFLKTRVMGVSIPLHKDFEEVNLRFYVRRKEGGTWKRGVVFIKEIVPRYAIAAVARLLYGEKYAAMPMRHSIWGEGSGTAREGRVEYGWFAHDRWNRLGVCTVGESQPLQPGSEEEFITEHYWGYASLRRGGCIEYQVEHPSWRVWQVSQAWLDCDIPRLYGKAFIEALSGPPASAFLAEGSPVWVYRGSKLEKGKSIDGN